jgi:hypothetical protein
MWIDLEHRLLCPVGELVGGLLQAAELDIAADVQAEQTRELAMEMEFRTAGERGQLLDPQGLFEVMLDVSTHAPKTLEIAVPGDDWKGLGLHGDIL